MSACSKPSRYLSDIERVHIVDRLREKANTRTVLVTCGRWYCRPHAAQGRHDRRQQAPAIRHSGTPVEAVEPGTDLPRFARTVSCTWFMRRSARTYTSKGAENNAEKSPQPCAPDAPAGAPIVGLVFWYFSLSNIDVRTCRVRLGLVPRAPNHARSNGEIAVGPEMVQLTSFHGGEIVPRTRWTNGTWAGASGVWCSTAAVGSAGAASGGRFGAHRRRDDGPVAG